MSRSLPAREREARNVHVGFQVAEGTGMEEVWYHVTGRRTTDFGIELDLTGPVPLRVVAPTDRLRSRKV